MKVAALCAIGRVRVAAMGNTANERDLPGQLHALAARNDGFAL